MRSRHPSLRTRRASGRDSMAKLERRFWLIKSEPSECSFADLWACRGRTTAWDGVRNYQARNFLRDRMQLGDGVLFYHSNAVPPAVVGVAEVARAAYPDPTQFERGHERFDPRAQVASPAWFAVDIRAVRRLARSVTLDELKRRPELARMVVVQRGSRLSVQPVTAAEFAAVLRLGAAPGA